MSLLNAQVCDGISSLGCQNAGTSQPWVSSGNATLTAPPCSLLVGSHLTHLQLGVQPESDRSLYRFLGLFVWVALCSAPTIPATSVSLNSGLSPELSETCLVSPSQCYHPEKTFRSKLEQSQTSSCFPSLRDHTVRPHRPTAESHFMYFMQFSCLWQIQFLVRCPIASGTNYQDQVLRHDQKLKLRLFWWWTLRLSGSQHGPVCVFQHGSSLCGALSQFPTKSLFICRASHGWISES